jgi:hypothetical protein
LIAFDAAAQFVCIVGHGAGRGKGEEEKEERETRYEIGDGSIKRKEGERAI